MGSETKKKARISKRAQCIRRGSTTVALMRKLMPNAPFFNAGEIRPEWSSKFQALIEEIRVLDAKDMKAHGTLFKHFVFTDMRESAYGVKALSAHMIAAGFDFCMKKQPKTMMRHGKEVETKNGETVFVKKSAVEHGSNRFAVLQSLPLWKNALSITTKKAILGAFNARPDNIYGEHLRVIVLDSKYKEGIDLFDVKYVHLLEPPIAASDLKQAVGRATRFCGQRGLPFVPRRGWPLEVFIYTAELPNRAPFTMGDGQKVDAHELMLRESGLDLALIHLTKELTVLAISSAVDYDLNYKINNFDIESALLDVGDVLVAEVEPGAAGGARKVVAIHDVADITPARMHKCFARKTKLFPFSKKLMGKIARALKLKAPAGAKREWYCQQLTSRPDYLEALLSAPPEVVRRRPVIGSIDVEIPSSVRGSIQASPAGTLDMTNTYSAVQRLFVTPKTGLSKAVSSSVKDLASLPFADFQEAISDIYAEHKWDSPVVKSGCETTAVVAAGRPVSFTRTQDFVRHYLTPASVFKGLLAWHSVGTGKTCMAVAAATTQFEQAGYTILWVTRNALMADVYKNIFGSVCSIPIMEELKKGYELPEGLDAQKRLLSRMWIKPISYRMFQNALEKKNELGRALWANSPSDPLKKTFLVMDEIHKLRDGDLGAAEAANFDIIQSFIHKSYAASGAESVRPLLMTATPITDTPVELFDILNTLIGNAEQRLMPFDEFRKEYTDEKGVIGKEGRDYFQERAKGLISYLNREYDPTTFAQPVFHTIRVGLSDISVPTVSDMADRCMGSMNLVRPSAEEGEDCSEIDYEMDAALRRIESEMEGGKEKRVALAAVKKTYKARRAACVKKGRATRKAVVTWEKGLMKAAKRCYAGERRAYRHERQTTQMGALEKCFGKGNEFIPYDEYIAEIKRRVESPDQDFSSVGAVKTPQ